MTTTEAAAVIGCSIRHVKSLCQRKKLKALRLTTQDNRGVITGYHYSITRNEARRYAKTKCGGWPRGKPRSKKPEEKDDE